MADAIYGLVQKCGLGIVNDCPHLLRSLKKSIRTGGRRCFGVLRRCRHRSKQDATRKKDRSPTTSVRARSQSRALDCGGALRATERKQQAHARVYVFSGDLSRPTQRDRGSPLRKRRAHTNCRRALSLPLYTPRALRFGDFRVQALVRGSSPE